ncbi:MAG TPA: hypothetical protein VK866_09065, partial [Acidimicrobiales bacterium]|nr:hypothetical protein [Acidimicrobiales bacterium]
MTVPSLQPVRSTRPRSSRRALAALVAVLALGLTAVVAPVGAQTAPSTASGTASGWLASQLVDGQRLETTFDGTSFPDYGLTADAVLAFAAAGVADPQAAAATSWLVANAAAYVGDGTDAVFAGSTAKLALVAQVRGLDPRAVGGADLVARLLDREQADGRFTDLSEFGDFSNPITQSLAILVLARQPGVSPSDAAIDRLLAVRCADGGIASSLDADPATCTSGVDGTAFAVQALIAAGRPGDAATIAGALDFLEAAQQAGGGLGTTADAAPNANSTGVAAQALAAGGRGAAASAAQGFLVSLQQGCDADAADRGAIAFDATGFEPSNAARATTQAILGLAGQPFG